MWLTGLVAPRHVGSSQTRARTRVPCIGRQILNHCATREAPTTLLICAESSFTQGATQNLQLLNHLIYKLEHYFQEPYPLPLKSKKIYLFLSGRDYKALQFFLTLRRICQHILDYCTFKNFIGVAGSLIFVEVFCYLLANMFLTRASS